MPTKNLKTSWDRRQRHFGNTNRSVMLKNLPNYLNNTIHRKHINYILGEMYSNYRTMLDVGCGWGRISKDILIAKPDLTIDGVELTEGFANHFSKTIGPCFQGTAQDFIPQKKYDLIIFVTVLMYLDYDEILAVLDRMWQALNINGKLICIEPATNIITDIRISLKVEKFEPTGKSVTYFHPKELQVLFSRLGIAHRVSSEKNLGFLPYINVPTVHRALSVIKVN